MHVQLIKDFLCVIWRELNLHINNSLSFYERKRASQLEWNGVSTVLLKSFLSAFRATKKEVSVHLGDYSIIVHCSAWVKLIFFFLDLRALDKKYQSFA